MDIAEIESLFDAIRQKVGGFTAGMEDHIERLLGKTGSDDPAPVYADPEVAAAVETMSAPAEPEASAA